MTFDFGEDRLRLGRGSICVLASLYRRTASWSSVSACQSSASTDCAILERTGFSDCLSDRLIGVGPTGVAAGFGGGVLGDYRTPSESEAQGKSLLIRKKMKQSADRFKSENAGTSDEQNRLIISIKLCKIPVFRNEVSEREAKFFLDSNDQSSYHDRKFLGDFPACEKFHLRTLGKLLNWCSYFWGGLKRPLSLLAID